MPASTLSDQLHRSIERYRSGHRVRGLRVIGIDESSYRKRHKYATLVYDLERSVVVWVGQGRGRATIDPFFDHQLSDYQKSQIHTGCCDMSEAYMGAISSHCPNAQLVLDRFHIVKALNDAIDDVRKEQWRRSERRGQKSSQGIALAAVPAFIHSFAPGHADSQGAGETQPENSLAGQALPVFTNYCLVEKNQIDNDDSTTRFVMLVHELGHLCDIWPHVDAVDRVMFRAPTDDDSRIFSRPECSLIRSSRFVELVH